MLKQNTVKRTHKRKFNFLLAFKISFSIDLFTLSETLSESTKFSFENSIYSVQRKEKVSQSENLILEKFLKTLRLENQFSGKRREFSEFRNLTFCGLTCKFNPHMN